MAKAYVKCAHRHLSLFPRLLRYKKCQIINLFQMMMKSKKILQECNNNAFYALVEKIFLDSFSFFQELKSLTFVCAFGYVYLFNHFVLF